MVNDTTSTLTYDYTGNIRIYIYIGSSNVSKTALIINSRICYVDES